MFYKKILKIVRLFFFKCNNIPLIRQVGIFLYKCGLHYALVVFKKKLPEIKAIYSPQTRGIDNIVNGLVGRWLMNEKHSGATATVASSVIDVSGNGNHGTPVNNPIYRQAPMRLYKPQILTG